MTVTTTAGVRVAVDVGTVRVGIAASDPTGVLASPVMVVKRDRRDHRDLDQVVQLVHDRQAVEVLVGLPQTLAGRDSSSTSDARAYAARLAQRVAPVPVRLVDERLTTVSAQRQLHAAGHDTRSSRGVVDAVAAVILLEAALDHERNTGVPVGEVVHP